MLRDWRKKQPKATECGALKDVLEKAGQTNLADELFSTSWLHSLIKVPHGWELDEHSNICRIVHRTLNIYPLFATVKNAILYVRVYLLRLDIMFSTHLQAYAITH